MSERRPPISIGAWWFDPELNRLRSDNSVIHLEPKAALALKMLVERAGTTVTRQELLDSVWKDVVVSDDALTQVIIKLRKALGDSSRDPRYIQTIPKRGYCLLAEVYTEPRSTETPTTQSSPEAPEKPLRLLGALAALIALLAGAIGFLLAYDQAPIESDTNTANTRPLTEGTTLTVMAFETATEQERERRFARGIRADLITDLARFADVTIVAPSITETAPINVRYQVRGNVQQVGERIGVHIRLVESASRKQIWSQRYERDLKGVFEVQRTISRDVADQLAIKVTKADMHRLASRYTPKLPAYEDFLRGQAELLLRQEEANLKARHWYRQAIERDPNFARAYAGLALSHAADYRNQWAEDGEKALRQAQEMAQTGAQIDPEMPEVYWVLGYVAAQFKRHETALAHLEHALEIDNSFADAYALMGGINTYLGRPQRSIGQLRNALRLNQDAGYLYYLLLGRAYFFTGRYEQALINLRESLARNPTNLETHIYLLATAVAQQDGDAAEWETEEIRMIEPGFKGNAWLETYPMTDESQRDLLAIILNRVEP